jgi:hypothetical protein
MSPHRVAVAAASILLLIVSLTASAQPSCTFTLGFQMLRDQMREIVGDCLENEHFNQVNGNAEQRTTAGLLVWRKCDNWTAFTNGTTTWIHGPTGLVTRPNAGPLFPFESPSCPNSSAPVQPQPPPGPPTAAPPASVPNPPATAVAAPSDRPPAFTLRFPPKVAPNQYFQIEIQATDDLGLRHIAWRAEGTRDQALRAVRSADCRGSYSCSFTWWEVTDEEDDLEIVAEAVDIAGQRTAGSRKVQVEQSSDNDTGECDPSYPDFCLNSPPPDLDCDEIPFVNFTVRGRDPHRFDPDKDGRGCNSD